MIIKFDRSYISAGTRELIERGYAREELDKLVFRFEYTEEERIQNREMAVKLSSEVWAASADRAARRRSEMMEPVMKSIAGEFVCYQYDHEEKLALRSTKWDLFFHCNALNVLNASAAGRDYSYFTLSFNREHTVEQRMEICGRVIRLLQERFAAHPNLHYRCSTWACWTRKKSADSFSGHFRPWTENGAPIMAGKDGLYWSKTAFSL